MKVGIVYFGNGLSDEDYFDEKTRALALKNARELVLSVPEVEITSELLDACALIVRISDLNLRQLQAVLEKSGAGALEISDSDRPMFRAAR